MAVAAAVVAVVGVIVEAVSAEQQNTNASEARHLAKSKADQQAVYAKQLNDLMANPSSILDEPGAKAATQATTRQMASLGYLGSGNMAAALQQTNLGYIQNRENFLAELAGVNEPINPLINTAASATAYSNQMQQGALAQLGYGVTKAADAFGSMNNTGIQGWGTAPSASALPSTMSYSDYQAALNSPETP